MLNAKIMMLEKRNTAHVSEIASLKTELETKSADMPVDEPPQANSNTEELQAKYTEAQEQISRLVADLQGQQQKFASMEGSMVEQKKQAAETEAFMRDELDVWQTSANDIEAEFKTKMERLISPTKVSQQREGFETQIADEKKSSDDKQKEQQELVTFLEETIQKLQNRGQATELMEVSNTRGFLFGLQSCVFEVVSDMPCARRRAMATN